MIIDFGKYKGAEVDDILEEDPEYLIWCYENINYQDVVSDDLYAEAQNKLQEQNDGQ